MIGMEMASYTFKKTKELLGSATTSEVNDPVMNHLFGGGGMAGGGYVSYCGRAFTSPRPSREKGECPACQEAYTEAMGQPYPWARKWESEGA